MTSSLEISHPAPIPGYGKVFFLNKCLIYPDVLSFYSILLVLPLLIPIFIFSALERDLGSPTPMLACCNLCKNLTDAKFSKIDHSVFITLCFIGGTISLHSLTFRVEQFNKSSVNFHYLPFCLIDELILFLTCFSYFILACVNQWSDSSSLQIILAREYLKDVTVSRDQLKYLVMEAIRGGCQVLNIEILLNCC